VRRAIRRPRDVKESALSTVARVDAEESPYPPAPSPVRGGEGVAGRGAVYLEIDRDSEATVARRIRTRAAAKELRRQTTETEKRVWAELRLYKIDGLQYRQQHPIGPYIVDFCCHRAKLVVEIDGKIHEQQREYDAERDQYLEMLGYTVLRFSTNRVLHDLDAMLSEIRAACSPSPRPGEGAGG